LDSKISSKISASLNVNFINVEEFRLLDEQNRGATLQAIVLPASDSYDPNKNYNLIVRSLEYNSLTEVNFSDNLGLSNSLIASLGIEYDITEGVSFDENGGVDFSDQRNERR
jgi:TonB-dependent starch-binding outer membrane protein SusC